MGELIGIRDVRAAAERIDCKTSSGTASSKPPGSDRVSRRPERTAYGGARFLPVGLSVGVAVSSASPSQSKDSGTRYGGGRDVLVRRRPPVVGDRVLRSPAGPR